MHHFKFVAYSSDRKRQVGEIQATSITDCRCMLKNHFSSIVSIKKVGGIHRGLNLIKQQFSNLFPIRKKNVAMFCYEMSMLLKADLSIKQALQQVADGASSHRFKAILQEVIMLVGRGYTLAESFQRYKKILPNSFISYLKYPGSSKELALIFSSLSSILARKNLLVAFLVTAVPQFTIFSILCITSVIINIRYTVLHLKLMTVFKVPVPFFVKVHHVFANMLSVDAPTWIAGAVIFIIVFCMLKATLPWFRWWVGFVFEHMPVIGSLIRASIKEAYATAICILLDGGLPVQKAVIYAVGVVKNPRYRLGVYTAADQLNSGADLVDTLRANKLFSKTELQLISIGVLSNEVSAAFHRLYESNKTTVETRTRLVLGLFKVILYLTNFLLFALILFVIEEVLTGLDAIM